MWFQTVDELRGCSNNKEELILSCESCKATLADCKNRNIQSWKLAQWVKSKCRWFKPCQLCSNCACRERKQIKPQSSSQPVRAHVAFLSWWFGPSALRSSIFAPAHGAVWQVFQSSALVVYSNRKLGASSCVSSTERHQNGSRVFSELLVFYPESDDLKWASRTRWGARLHRPPGVIFAQITSPTLSPVWMRLVFGCLHECSDRKQTLLSHWGTHHHHRHHHLIKLDCSVLEVHGDGVI